MIHHRHRTFNFSFTLQFGTKGIFIKIISEIEFFCLCKFVYPHDVTQWSYQFFPASLAFALPEALGFCMPSQPLHIIVLILSAFCKCLYPPRLRASHQNVYWLFINLPLTYQSTIWVLIIVYWWVTLVLLSSIISYYHSAVGTKDFVYPVLAVIILNLNRFSLPLPLKAFMFECRSCLRVFSSLLFHMVKPDLLPLQVCLPRHSQIHLLLAANSTSSMPLYPYLHLSYHSSFSYRCSLFAYQLLAFLQPFSLFALHYAIRS